MVDSHHLHNHTDWSHCLDPLHNVLEDHLIILPGGFLTNFLDHNLDNIFDDCPDAYLHLFTVIPTNQVKIRTNFTIIDCSGRAWVAVGLARQIGGENFLFFLIISIFSLHLVHTGQWTCDYMQNLFLSLDFAPKVRSVLDEHWSRTRLLGKQSEAAWTWLLDLDQVTLNVKAFPKLWKIFPSSRGISGLPQQWSVPAPKVVAVFIFGLFLFVGNIF